MSSCYIIATGAPLICWPIGVAVQHLSFHDPITGRLGTRHASSDIDETRFIYLFFKDIFILLYNVCVTVLLCDAEFEHL